MKGVQWLPQSYSRFSVTGSLPASWGAEGHFPNLLFLILSLTNLTGSLPASWGGEFSFPSIEGLIIGADAVDISHLSGTLPSEWGSAYAFQRIVTLAITNCNITGTYHPMYVFKNCIVTLNSAVSVLSFSFCMVTATWLYLYVYVVFMPFLTGFWRQNEALQALHTYTQGSEDRNSPTSYCLVLLYLMS